MHEYESAVDRHTLPVRDSDRRVPAEMDQKHQRDAFSGVRAVRAPDGAAIILLVMRDVVGFGTSSAFGGPVRMPTAERLTGEGASYTRFHAAPLCSPTRAATLTGRNHHSVGMGVIAENAT